MNNDYFFYIKDYILTFTSILYEALPFIVRVKRESPGAVEVQPFGAVEVGARMFGKRDLGMNGMRNGGRDERSNKIFRGHDGR